MSKHCLYRRGGKLMANGRRSKGDFARRIADLSLDLRADRISRKRREKIDRLLAVDRKRKAAAVERLSAGSEA